MARHKTRAQKKRDNVMFGLVLFGGGVLALVAMLGLLQVRFANGVVMGTMRGGTVHYVPPGTTQEKPVTSWFHSSGREKIREGDAVPVILNPGGAQATSKHPTTLALYCLLGGGAAMAIGIAILRSA